MEEQIYFDDRRKNSIKSISSLKFSFWFKQALCLTYIKMIFSITYKKTKNKLQPQNSSTIINSEWVLSYSISQGYAISLYQYLLDRNSNLIANLYMIYVSSGIAYDTSKSKAAAQS